MATPRHRVLAARKGLLVHKNPRPTKGSLGAGIMKASGPRGGKAAFKANKVLGAHPLHSDTHHAMTGASHIPKPPKLHVHKPYKAPKGAFSKKRGI